MLTTDMGRSGMLMIIVVLRSTFELLCSQVCVSHRQEIHSVALQSFFFAYLNLSVLLSSFLHWFLYFSLLENIGKHRNRPLNPHSLS